MSVQHYESVMRGLVAAYRAFSPTARKLGADAQLEAERGRARGAQEAAQRLESDRHRIQAAVRRAMDGAREAATRTAAQLAPGVAALPFDAAGWGSIGAAAPTHLRVGVSGDVPIIAPLLPTAGWYVEGNDAAALIRGAVLRVVAATPARRVRVDSYDPRLTGALGVFGELRERAAEIVPDSLTGAADLAACLDDLVGTVAGRAQKIAQTGHRSFEALMAAEPRLLEAYRLVVLLDYPLGVDERLQRELLRVAESAAGRGVSFLVQHNPAVQPEREVDPAALARLLRPVRAERDRITVAGIDGVAIRPDAPPGSHLFAQVAESVGAAASSASLPKVAFADMLPPRQEWWTPIAADGELKVAVGADGRTPAFVRLRSGNPPLPNVLIGGSAGQGKSNLLLVLIHGLAARYSPKDLEMHLLDFKQGLEFAKLGPPYWLPHIKVLGVYSDREFGLAVLRHVHDQMEVRSEIFKRAGKGNIADLTEAEGRPPRLLLVLDEFQVMLADDDAIADEATALLEKLVRMGRAYGIHLVLATQTIEGIQRLATKRDAIFGQVPNRVVLKTTPGDSQTLLATHNTAAAALRFRGEAILNENYGALDHNRTALIAHARDEELESLRKELWHHARVSEPPRIFEQNEAASLTRALAGPVEADGYSVRAWAGMPVSVAERPAAFDVRQEPGAGLIVLGDDAASALGVLTGVAMSISKGRPGDGFLLLDPMPPEPAIEQGIAALRQALRPSVAGREEIPERLLELRDEVRKRNGSEPWLHVLAFGMHRATRLKAAGSSDSWLNLGAETPASPLDALREIVQEGPAVGVFLYGWWNRLNVCADQLGLDRCHVNAHLFLRHPLDGVQQVCGPLTAWSSRPHRGLLRDGLSDEPLPTVTFAPLTLEEV
ncbi:FtsK/SpoIIIE domain-containing protein [Nonomuraea sp. NPDC050556]|uniref:FtsK/SpoIIIE domain-containing protein n=1 Tax=Nonomuraea sp. NPDC050556 TaxID=3364369 RepID=UPI0037B80C5F